MGSIECDLVHASLGKPDRTVVNNRAAIHQNKRQIGSVLRAVAGYGQLVTIGVAHFAKQMRCRSKLLGGRSCALRAMSPYDFNALANWFDGQSSI